MSERYLKKSLFGYTRDSVRDYVTDVTKGYKRKLDESNQKILELTRQCDEYKASVDELTEKQNCLLDELSGKISASEAIAPSVVDGLKEEIEALKKALELKDAEIAGLKAEDDSYSRSDIADVMLNAKVFANELKLKAENEYAAQMEDIRNQLDAEKAKTDKYITLINGLYADIYAVCTALGAEIKGKGEELEFVNRAVECGVLNETEDSCSDISKKDSDGGVA